MNVNMDWDRLQLTVMTFASCISNLCDPAKRHRVLKINEIKVNTLDRVFSVRIMTMMS